MRSNSSILPPPSLRDSSIFPRRRRFSKMFSAGGQVPTQMEAPASAIALAMANPNPPSSATPATSARLPERSMGSMRAHIARAAPGCKSRDGVGCAAHAPLGVGDGGAGARRAGGRHGGRGRRGQRGHRGAGAACRRSPAAPRARDQQGAGRVRDLRFDAALRARRPARREARAGDVPRRACGIAVRRRARAAGSAVHAASAGAVAARRGGGGARPAALVLGAYDGFFGPGSGTFLILAFAFLFDLPLQRASADAKPVNFASNLAALALFSARGAVLWELALPMAAAQFAGGWLGAHLAVRGGDRLVRVVVLLVVVALVSKLAADMLRASG